MNRLLLRSMLLALSLGLMSSSVFATSLTAQQTLEQFNLVVLSDANSTSHVDGRTYVGGNLAGTGAIYAMSDKTSTSAYAGLTVRGNASGLQVNHYGAVIGGDLSNSIINSPGDAVVLGTARDDTFNGSAYVNNGNNNNKFNGKAYVNNNAYTTTSDPNNINSQEAKNLANGTAATAATSTNFANVLNELSGQLKELVSTGSYVTIEGTKATFNAVVDTNGVAVFTITDSSIFTTAIGEYAFNLNGATTVIINSAATNVTTSANFIGGGAQAIGAKTLWNFYDATTITLNSQFGGSILATKATLTNWNNIEGGVYVNTLDQKGEIHLQSFTGTIPAPTTAPVPEPTTMLLFGTGLAGLAGFTKRKRS